MLSELSLFSGYGGFTLGLRLTGVPIRTVGYVEIDEYCQRLIQARIRDGLLDWAPIIRDIRSADFRPMAGLVDIVTAGFPCQPHSIAGKHLGERDERNLWPETIRVIGEVRPQYVLLENVPNLLSTPYWGTILAQLSLIGYDARWGIVSACEVGAPHTRERVFCLAYPNGSDGEARMGLVSNRQGPISERDHQAVSGNWIQATNSANRDIDGVASRVDRLKALGNGIVPSVVKRFLRGYE